MHTADVRDASVANTDLKNTSTQLWLGGRTRVAERCVTLSNLQVWGTRSVSEGRVVAFSKQSGEGNSSVKLPLSCQAHWIRDVGMHP